jgi:hypothetical protein
MRISTKYLAAEVRTNVLFSKVRRVVKGRREERRTLCFRKQEHPSKESVGMEGNGGKVMTYAPFYGFADRNEGFGCHVGVMGIVDC